VIPSISLDTFRFEAPALLWLLVVPGALLVVWCWRVVRRRADTRRLLAARVLPVRERYNLAGDLTFWLAAILASALCIVAIAKPQARIALSRRASADVVILQDASASMYVSDVRPDRWRRSVQFLRTFAESLSWRGDRVALALFAQLAAPQVRLTKDPNSLFFFIDHLGEHSPFPLENLTTWDTNIEEGIRWGLNLIEKDEQLFGKSGNPKAFLVVSDGQAWTGDVARALQTAKFRKVPVFVVGVGTTVGGMIPEPAGTARGRRHGSTRRSTGNRCCRSPSPAAVNTSRSVRNRTARSRFASSIVCAAVPPTPSPLKRSRICTRARSWPRPLCCVPACCWCASARSWPGMRQAPSQWSSCLPA
jgi:hypothetical protein